MKKDFVNTEYFPSTSVSGTTAYPGDPIRTLGLHALVFHVAWTSTPTGTIIVQESDDGTTWRTAENATVSAQPAGSASSARVIYPCTAMFARLHYTNAASTGAVSASLTALDVPVIMELAGDGGALGSVTVSSGSVAVTDVVPGTTATKLGKAQDAIPGATDTGIAVLFVQKATPANVAGTDGDYERPQMSGGRVWASSLVTNVVPGVGATDLGKAQDAVPGSTDTGVAVLAVRKATPADVAGTEGDYERLQTKDGRLYVRATADLPSSIVAGENTGIDSATAEQIVTASTPLAAGMWVQADPGNTGYITLTVSGGTVGVKLYARDKIFLPVNNANLVYAIASVDEENVQYWGS